MFVTWSMALVSCSDVSSVNKCFVFSVRRQKESAIVVQKYIRRHLAQKEAEKRRWAVGVVRR